MIALFESLSLCHIAWFSVIVYALHYAEEGPFLVEWFSSHYKLRGLTYNQKKLNLENIILFTMNLGFILLLTLYPDNWILQALVLSAAVGFILNTWFHGRATLASKVYSPGVVTACLLNPILFILYFEKALQLGLLVPKIVVVAVIFGLVGLPLAIFLSHKVLLRSDREGRAKWLNYFPVRAKVLTKTKKI